MPLELDEPITVVYKSIQDIDLCADFYLPNDNHAQPDVDELAKRPTIVYFHGGALTCGNRASWKPEWMIREANARLSWIFVSADYRLLFPCTGHDILDDVKDLFAWLSQPIPELASSPKNIGKVSVDPSRLIAAGTSAGGYLAYLAGLWAEPRPKGVISMYGLGGDLLTPQYLERKTKPFFRGRPLLDPTEPRFASLLSRTDPPAPIADNPLRYEPSGMPADPRMLMNRVLLQEAIFLDYVTGEHGLSSLLSSNPDPSESKLAQRDLIPEKHRVLFPQFHVSPSFPPTLFVHGTEDSAVLAHESAFLARSLEASGVPNKLVLVQGAEHSFDYHTDGVHEPLLRESISFVVQFV